MRPKIADVARAVSQVSGCEIGDLVSPVRTKRLSEARHVAIWMAIKYASPNQTKVASYFNRDHTTARYAKSRIENTSDPLLKADVENALEVLRKEGFDVDAA